MSQRQELSGVERILYPNYYRGPRSWLRCSEGTGGTGQCPHPRLVGLTEGRDLCEAGLRKRLRGTSWLDAALRGTHKIEHGVAWALGQAALGSPASRQAPWVASWAEHGTASHSTSLSAGALGDSGAPAWPESLTLLPPPQICPQWMGRKLVPMRTCILSSTNYAAEPREQRLQ